MVVLKSAKVSLEKCMSGCLDLAAQMEVKAAVDNALAPKAKEIKAAAEALAQFLSELRSFVSAAEMQGGGADDLGTKASKCEDYKMKAVAHQEGWKSMSKRMRALL